MEKAKWDVEDFYNKSFERLKLKRNVKYIFVFGNKLKLKEFIEHIIPHDNYFVLFTKEWDYKTLITEYDEIVPIDIAKMRLSVMFNQKEIIQVNKSGNEKRCQFRFGDKVWAINDKERISGYYRLERVFGTGGEAVIYTSRWNRKKLIKLYHYQVSEHKKAKLKLLAMMKTKLLTVPEEILKQEKAVVGFSMLRVRGTILKKMLSNRCCKKINLIKMLKNLAIGLLELELRNIIVVDLSLSNIVLKPNKKDIQLIDCDSLQIYNFCSGVESLPDYKHRELVEKESYIKEPLHLYFAYAVLAFKTLVSGILHPLFQYEAQEEYSIGKLYWGRQFEFPYKLNVSEDNNNVRVDSNENWKELPEPLRKMFFEVFTFSNECNLGRWIEMLEKYL